ncbi:MAG: very short patch repair endonuclease [Bifidobacterium sp.]|nr:very short patch repair endonuclease [Bifidobacterium sp.]
MSDDSGEATKDPEVTGERGNEAVAMEPSAASRKEPKRDSRTAHLETTPERSRIMAAIHGKDTSIERMVRRYLFARGFRFRKNDKRYPGRPDVVLPKWRTVVFVNGCFWHAHEGCDKFRLPKSNVEFWTGKLDRNRERDRRQHQQLRDDGWRVIDVWECELDKAHREARLDRLADEIRAPRDAE